jgi:hypothetical protein
MMPYGRSGKIPLSRISRVMVSQLFLVLLYLPVEFVDQAVYSSVHVFGDRFGENGTSAYIDFSFGFVSQFLNAENAVDIGEVVEMSLDAFEFVIYIVS